MESKKAFEYYIGKKKGAEMQRTKIEQPEDANKFARQFYSDDIGVYESFFIMLLDRRNTVTGWAKISQGGIAGTVVDLKIILKYAIDCLASGVIFVHNHPSGNLKPSIQDIKVTNKAKEALKLLDIKLLDHIIISDESDNSYNSIIND